jgi:tetratricopeptide (TPR) repeat protein/tRNA A-37 threonylcarbamoyl transferase component Bud32
MPSAPEADAANTLAAVPTQPTIRHPHPAATPTASDATAKLPSAQSDLTPVPTPTQPRPPADDRTLQQTADTRPAATPGRPAIAIPGYELLGELGRGGMGVVYKARHLKLNRLVALKMVLSGEFARSTDLERFRSEALRLAKVQHPNIVHIYDVGEYAGRPYFAMEYVDGGTLAGHLAGRPQPPCDAATLAETLALAIQAAHQRGIVHRDLKPANILLASGRVVGGESSDRTTHHSPLTTHQLKIADFGLAKETEEGSATVTGGVLGTPSYMSPEQAAGRSDEVGPAGDVYSLGTILYEMLAGRPPFRGLTPRETIDMVLKDEPTGLRATQPEVPRDLETVCLKCLHKDPARRYASAQHLAEDLRRFLDGMPVLARPVGTAERLWMWARRRPAMAALAATVAVSLVLLFAVGAYFNDLLRHERDVARDERNEAQRQRQIAQDNATLAEARFRQSKQAVDRYYSEVSENVLPDEPGLEPLRLTLLGLARDYYNGFVRERGEDPSVLADRARGLFRLAQITGEVGQRPEAVSLLEQARDLFKQLLDQYPGDRSLRGELADTNYHLGRLNRLLGRLEPAAAAYATALDSWRALRDEAPDAMAAGKDPEAETARVLLGIGNVAVERSQFDAALTRFRESLAIRERLVAKHPKTESHRRDLATTWGNIAVWYSMTGNAAQSIAAREKSLEVYSRLVQDFPNRDRFRHDVAQAEFNLGKDQLQAGNAAAAAARLDKAAVEWDRLHQTHPAVGIYATSLANARFMGSQVEEELSHEANADRMLSQATLLREKIAAEAPGDLEARSAVALCVAERADRLWRRGDLQEAEIAGRDAVSRRLELAASPAAPVRFRVQLARSQYTLARILAGAGQLEAARAALSQFQTTADALLKQAPDDWVVRQLKLDDLWAEGDIEMRTGGPQQALARFDAEVAEIARLQSLPHPPAELRKKQRDAAWGRANALTALGQYPQALAAWDQAIAFDDTNEKHFLRVYRLATLARTREYPDAIAEADKTLEQARRSPLALYSLARVYAIAATNLKGDDNRPADERSRKTEVWAATAVKLLGDAKDLDQFRYPQRLAALDADNAFANLRDRKDYQSFRASLNR